MFNDKTILVTGGTGSFGKQLCKTLLENYEPKKIIVYSRDELKQYEMLCNDFFSKYCSKEKDIMRFFIGDVRDLERIKFAMMEVDFVIHAAALKQVPATEYNPFEAVKTNVLGAQNVIDAAIYSGVKKVMALSTDKAAAPINLYGATKLTSDKLFITANNYNSHEKIRFSSVRYGNVMGSRGSVIPYFMRKRVDGILPITDERMTRFNITLQQGVDFVLKCFEVMWGGELFVPKIPSYKILDLAEAVAPECKREIVGIRPGEKLHEEMITENDAVNTIEFKDYYVIVPSIRNWSKENFINKSNGEIGKTCKDGFSYNSGTNNQFLTVEELRKLISENISI